MKALLILYLNVLLFGMFGLTLFLFGISLKGLPFLADMWPQWIPPTSWGIWKERNNHVFRNTSLPAQVVTSKICRQIVGNFHSGVVDVIVFPKIILPSYEFRMILSGDSIFISLFPQRIFASLQLISSWSFRPQGGWRWIFDGPAKGDLGLAGCGGVLRDENGGFISAVVLPLGSQTNRLAKVVATYHGLSMASQLNNKSVWLQGDSKNIIQCLNGSQSPSWNIQSCIRDTVKIIESFDNCIISHASKEFNCVANYFANVGAQSNAKKYRPRRICCHRMSWIWCHVIGYMLVWGVLIIWYGEFS